MIRYALIVEDDPMVAALITSVLKASGFAVETALDSASARLTLKSFDPDIVIVDINLGDGPNGIDLAHFVTRHLDHAAVLILTKYLSPELMGFDLTGLPDSVGFLAKAHISDAAVLLAAIEKALVAEAEQILTVPG